MDVLNILIPHEKEVCTGTYYERMPNTPNDNGITFDYENVDTTEWHYQQLFANVPVKGATSAAIKTCDPMDWKVGGYIATQDGRFYTIIAVQQDYKSASEQAFRNLSLVPGVHFVIRMTEKENPWGLK